MKDVPEVACEEALWVEGVVQEGQVLLELLISLFIKRVGESRGERGLLLIERAFINITMLS